MAKEKEIQDIQQDHFSQPTEYHNAHFETDEKELEKYLDKVEKEFIKQERENVVKNKKDYLASKIEAKKDDLYKITKEQSKQAN